jgi:hypothetical protein
LQKIWTGEAPTVHLLTLAAWLQKEQDGSQSKMVHFYFSQNDAQALVDRVRQLMHAVL